MIKAQQLPTNSVLFLLQADRWLSNDQTGHKFAMACWNLRDKFKSDRRTLVLLGHDMNSLPAELGGDTLQLDDPLPRKEEIRQIITDNVISQFNRSIERHNVTVAPDQQRPVLDIEPAQLSQAVDANLGLTAYQVEQFTAMALRGGGIDIRSLEDRKEKQIERTPGLSVFRQGSTFTDVGGCGPVKEEITSLMQSTKRHFQAVVWLDEIEKTGLGNTSDLSGVNSDAEGQILTYMEDHNPYAIVLVGVPGCGKSEIAKAAGATFTHQVGADRIPVRDRRTALHGLCTVGRGCLPHYQGREMGGPGRRPLSTRESDRAETGGCRLGQCRLGVHDRVPGQRRPRLVPGDRRPDHRTRTARPAWACGT